ncbi:MAG TPA: nickel pincer cofactor biosynthesis protein LarC [bacterium]|nr:nickel pincer cofactor biosynthesis protein LarC [bacterium]
MKIAYFDCFAGISGDMFAGAAVDAGVPIDLFRKTLKKIAFGGYAIAARRVTRCGVAGTQFIVDAHEHKRGHHHHGRSFDDIVRLLTKSGLDERIRADAIGIFTLLARAEAKVHRTTVGRVHFHEVGAVDSIVDIVCAAAAVAALGVERVFVSKLALGGGTVPCAHGTLPVPAPATAELVAGLPVVAGPVEAELVTPTGAAIVKYYGAQFGAMPEMTVSAVAYGAGCRDFPQMPNMFRLVIGETRGSCACGTAALIETNIDDMNPQIYEHLAGRLFKLGALDVWLTPVTMKKMRPAAVLSVLCAEAGCDAAVDAIFEETTTYGVRIQTVQRRTLERETSTVTTRYGRIRVKAGSAGGKTMTVTPEYEDCRECAGAKRVPLKRVMSAAVEAYAKDSGRSPRKR